VNLGIAPETLSLFLIGGDQLALRRHHVRHLQRAGLPVLP
jgi:hypothetical protein